MSVSSNKVSIIVPIYKIKNEYLEQCIQSLVNQTYSNIEIILVNDGSTAENKEICSRYQKLDERIVLINQENRGVSVARNEGIKFSTGEWICFVDPDDWAELDMVERLCCFISYEPKDIIICSTYINFKDKEVNNKFFLPNRKGFCSR